MNRGFTLFEIIIYMAILGIILFFISGFVFNGISGSGKIEAWQNVNDNGRFVSDKILRTLQDSKGVNGAL